jgi:hypothetical protein
VQRDTDTGTLKQRLVPPSGTVIEGRSAMLAVLSSGLAVVVTASDANAGARVVAAGTKTGLRFFRG